MEGIIVTVMCVVVCIVLALFWDRIREIPIVNDLVVDDSINVVLRMVIGLLSIILITMLGTLGVMGLINIVTFIMAFELTPSVVFAFKCFGVVGLALSFLFIKVSRYERQEKLIEELKR